jgi:hypothetical protein
VTLSGSIETSDNPNTATVCITDNSAYSVTIGLQQTAYTVTEVDEQQLVCFEVLSGDVNGREFVIDYTTSSGTATTTDYTTTSGEVTITEDVLFHCVSIPIRADSSTETINECFTFQISAAATIDGLSIQNNEAEICIVDKNAIPITIGFRQRLYYVDEDADSVVVCYDVLSGRTASRSIYMRLRTFQEEARDGEDYTYTYATDSLDDGDLNECNSIPIISDDIDEAEECFIVSISTSSTYSGLRLHPDVAIVCINDDDPTFVTIGLQNTTYSVDEADEYQVVCAEVLSGDIDGRSIIIGYTTRSSRAQCVYKVNYVVHT